MLPLEMQDRPRIYRMECDGDQIRVSVRAGLIAELSELETNPNFRSHLEHFSVEEKLLPLIGSSSKPGPWGFGGVMEREASSTDHDWVPFSARFPNVIINDDTSDWGRVFLVSHSLQMLFELLSMVKPCSVLDAPQACHVQLVTRQGAVHGGMIGIEVSPSFRAWIDDNLGDNERGYALREDVIEIMWKAIGWMWPCARFADPDCRLLNGRLYFDSGLGGTAGVLGWEVTEPGHGYMLEPHNCDSPIHQLTILAGAARLASYFPG